MPESESQWQNNPPDTPTAAVRTTRRVATPRRVAVAVVPIIAMLITPFLPFAQHPTLWFGMPAVLVWMAIIVVVTVVILNVVDRSIARQAAAYTAAHPEGDDPA